ncbi:MAG: hypothetical protein JWR26_2686 [Pedosphaera sp.]|nr:hypothetical protein [Pedosphaera sp.]
MGPMGRSTARRSSSAPKELRRTGCSRRVPHAGRALCRRKRSSAKRALAHGPAAQNQELRGVLADCHHAHGYFWAGKGRGCPGLSRFGLHCPTGCSFLGKGKGVPPCGVFPHGVLAHGALGPAVAQKLWRALCKGKPNVTKAEAAFRGWQGDWLGRWARSGCWACPPSLRSPACGTWRFAKRAQARFAKRGRSRSAAKGRLAQGRLYTVCWRAGICCVGAMGKSEERAEWEAGVGKRHATTRNNSEQLGVFLFFCVCTCLRMGVCTRPAAGPVSHRRDTYLTRMNTETGKRVCTRDAFFVACGEGDEAMPGLGCLISQRLRWKSFERFSLREGNPWASVIIEGSVWRA